MAALARAEVVRAGGALARLPGAQAAELAVGAVGALLVDVDRGGAQRACGALEPDGRGRAVDEAGGRDDTCYTGERHASFIGSKAWIFVSPPPRTPTVRSRRLAVAASLASHPYYRALIAPLYPPPPPLPFLYLVLYSVRALTDFYTRVAKTTTTDANPAHPSPRPARMRPSRWRAAHRCTAPAPRPAAAGQSGRRYSARSSLAAP